jgi:Fe-S-cluster-containing dehydrogenase component
MPCIATKDHNREETNNFVYITSYKKCNGTKYCYMMLPACDYQTVQLKKRVTVEKETGDQIKLHLHLTFLLQHIAGDTRY